MKDLATQVRKKPRTHEQADEEDKEPETQDQDTKPAPIASWTDIISANDTNKHIIFKFMRRGFTSLSAEELACTMVCPDFSLDF